MASASGGFAHRMPVVAFNSPLQQQAVAISSGRVLNTQQKQLAIDGPQLQSEDQATADTIGINFGVGVGLDTPLIDSLLERWLRRKQILAAAAAAGVYPPGLGWGIGSGYYPNPALYPYAGAGGFGAPWNRPVGYPYPYAPPNLNPFGNGFGGFAGTTGWGTFSGLPLNDFDPDFGLKNNNPNNQ